MAVRSYHLYDEMGVELVEKVCWLKLSLAFYRLSSY